MSNVDDLVDDLIEEIDGGGRPSRYAYSKQKTIEETMQTLMPSLRQAAAQQLRQLTSTGQQRALQESTIIEAAISRVFTGGYDRPEFWARPDVCARSTFNKWRKYQPEFVDVFEGVCQLAKNWRSSLALDSLEEALTLMQLHAPESAWKLIALMRNGTSEDVQQRMAAKDILDRASKDTADKSGGPAVEIRNLDTILEQIYGEDDTDNP